jgi:hypothetical protein
LPAGEHGTVRISDPYSKCYRCCEKGVRRVQHFLQGVLRIWQRFEGYPSVEWKRLFEEVIMP